jgi:Tellurite resistance protein TerB
LRGELLLSLIGVRIYFKTTGHGTLHCYRCGGDRRYHQCTGRRWLHVLQIPLVPLDRIAEHVQCRICRTRYRLEVLGLPTLAAMQAALPAGSLAAVTTMLRAGDPASAAARNLAIDLVRQAGLSGYDDAALTVDLAATDDPAADAGAPLRTLARQLTMPAPEWFLADAVRVGLADGPLSDEERDAARLIATYLGLTSAQAHGVIWLTEEGASAG